MVLPDKNLYGRIGLVLSAGLGIVVLTGILWADFTMHPRLELRNLAPSGRYLAGTDDLGRDLLGMTIIGLGVSLSIAVIVVLLSAAVGVTVGITAALAGGWVDIVIMRLVDGISAVPIILPAMLLSIFFPHSVMAMIMILVFCAWAGMARIVRSETVTVLSCDYILAARCMNASFSWIVGRHIYAGIRPVMMVQISLNFGGIILAESTLNFLGIGLPATVPTLGQMISGGRWHVFDRPLFILLPGTILAIVVLMSTCIAEGLRGRSE